MKQDGVTLIELLVVIAIMSIVTIALGFEFVGWMARYKVESEIKTMIADLTNARQRAMEKNIPYVAQLSANNYVICEDTNLDGACTAPAETTNSAISQALSKNGLKYPVNVNFPPGTILLDKRGFVSIAGNIWLTKPGTPGTVYDASEVDYDCISLSATRIGVGKYDNDGTKTVCATANTCCVK